MIDEYKDLLERYLSNLYAEYWLLETTRTNTPSDQYRADKLLQCCDLVADCNSFFIDNVKSINDVDKYFDYLNKIALKNCDDENKTFIVTSLTSSLFSLTLAGI